jgi:hypothetical protein
VAIEHRHLLSGSGGKRDIDGTAIFLGIHSDIAVIGLDLALKFGNQIGGIGIERDLAGQLGVPKAGGFELWIVQGRGNRRFNVVRRRVAAGRRLRGGR